MAAQIFPFGTPLTVVWHLTKPDGTAFNLDGYSYRAYYRTGNKETEATSTHLTASGNTLSITIPADEPVAPGEYALRLVLFQSGNLFCTLNYNAAFALSRQLGELTPVESQQQASQIVHLYTVSEYYLLSPVVPTVGDDGYWYVNGTKITDGNGEYIPSSHTVRYDSTTKYLIIDEGRVDKDGHSIQQTITDIATALADWEARYVAAEGSSSTSVAGDGSRWGSYKSAEAVREENETARKDAEGTPSDAAGANTRWGAEKQRIANETARQNAEGTSSDEAGANTRWGAEKQRIANETERQTAEGTSGDAAGANTRWGAEKQRQLNETARQEAEGTPDDDPTDPEVTTRWAQYKRALAATERANEAAAAAEHQVDVKRGYGIDSVTEPVVSTVNGGTNTIRVTTEDGKTFDFYVRNGKSSAGFFSTATALNTAIPSPNAGDYAFVSEAGDGTFPAYIYVCTTAGTWTATENEFTPDDPTDVLDVLNSTSTTAALSANQGKVLDGKITQLGQYLYKRYNAQNIRDNAYQNRITGEFVANNSYFVVEGIPVRGYEKIDIARTVTESDNAMGIVFYASDGTTMVGGDGFTGELTTIIVPDNAYYASITIRKSVYENNNQLLFQPYTFYKTNDLRQFIQDSIDNLIVEGTDTDFMQLDDNYNLFLPGKASIGYYINGTNGQLVASSSFAASDFVPVVPNTLYHIQGGEVVLARYYAFYNANKEYISGESSTTGWLTTLQTPDNAQYVRFSGMVATYNNIIFSKNPFSPSEYKYTPKSNVVIPISESTIDLTDVTLENAGNIIDRTKLIVGAYINATTGATVTTSQQEWVATDFCDIDPTKKYSWSKIQDFYAAFYDEGKNFILGYSTSSRMPNPVAPPANARYARYTINDSTANAYGVYPSQACWVGADSERRQPNEYKSYSLPKVVFTERELGAENPCDYTGKEIAVFNKILCIGDSLMYGAENVATGSPYIATKETLYNIPVFIRKMSGVDTTNAAHSGYTAEQWLADFGTQDLSGHDAAIIQIGVNNWLGWNSETDSAIDTFKTTLGQIIDYVVSQNAYNDSGTLKNKPKVFVATQFAAKSYTRNSHGLSVDVLNNAISNVVNLRSDCFLLDMASYSHSNDNIAYNRGHLTALGYRQVAQDYIGIISKYVNDNLDLFVDVPFVGTASTQFQYSPTEI